MFHFKKSKDPPKQCVVAARYKCKNCDRFFTVKFQCQCDAEHVEEHIPRVERHECGNGYTGVGNIAGYKVCDSTDQ